MNTGDLTPRRCYWETVCNTQEEQRQRFRKEYISHWGWLPSPFKSEIGDSKTHSRSPRHPPVRTGERITSNACAFTAVRIQALVLPTWPSICLWLRGGMIAETNRDHYSSKQQDTTFLAQHPLQRLQRRGDICFYFSPEEIAKLPFSSSKQSELTPVIHGVL